MANKWIEHVKSYAKTHGISYACAVSNPKCKSSYTAAQPHHKTPKLMAAMDARTLRDIKENMKRKKIVPPMLVGMSAKQ